METSPTGIQKLVLRSARDWKSAGLIFMQKTVRKEICGAELRVSVCACRHVSAYVCTCVIRVTAKALIHREAIEQKSIRVSIEKHRSTIRGSSDMNKNVTLHTCTYKCMYIRTHACAGARSSIHANFPALLKIPIPAPAPCPRGT